MKSLTKFCSTQAALAMGFSLIMYTAGAQTPKHVEQSNFGTADDGAAVKLITLRNSHGMSAQIITYGATIKDVEAPDRNGNFTNVVLTTDTLQKYQHGFSGASSVMGRVANRIAGAQFDLNGVTYKLNANDRRNTLHGGRKGFGQSVWTVAEIKEKDGEASVKLTYFSKDGEEGFPGNLKASVTYSLNDKNELRLDYFAETDKPTIANLTSHAYWNLAGGGSCLDNILWIPAQSYTPADAGGIPTGEILPVKETPLDFNQPMPISEGMAKMKPGMMNGYDNNFVLSSGKEMKIAARLVEPKSGRTMEIRTTQPAVQLYTANHLGHTAVCLETEHYPDSIHHSNFPSIVITPEQPLQESTVIAFSAK